MPLKIRTFRYFLREAGRGLGRNGLMSLAAATTMIVSLLIMGIFMILVANLNQIVDKARDEMQLRVMLQDDVSVDKAMQLRDTIEGYKNDGVSSVSFVSKQAAAAEVERIWNVPDLFSGMGENPLPDALVVGLQRGANVDKLVQKIENLPGVDDIVYRDFIRTMMLVIQILWIAGIALIIAVSMGVLYITVNTIRLTVYARRLEIEIMKLVGATDWFIRWPFIIEGLLLGLIGAVVSSLVLSKGYYFLFQSVQQIGVIPLASEAHINSQMLMFIFPAGLFFGIVGSLLSLKRFLRE